MGRKPMPEALRNIQRHTPVLRTLGDIEYFAQEMYRKGARDGAEKAASGRLLMALWLLHDKFGFGNKRLSRLIVVTNHAGTVAPGKCRVRQATKEELDELDKLLGPVDKSILAPNGGAKGIYALQEPHFRMPRNPAREEAEAKARAKKKAAFRAAMMKRNTK